MQIIIMAVAIPWRQSLQPQASRDLNKGLFIFTFPARSEMAGSMVKGGGGGGGGANLLPSQQQSTN